MRRFVLVLCLALVGLAGCSSGAEAIEVTVNGNLGAPVTISLEGDKVPASVTKDVVIAGKGREIEEDSAVLLRATSFDSRTGSIIESYDTGGIRLATANSDGLGELAGQIVGATEGSRLVITHPGLASGQDAAEIVVVDLLPTIAQGEETPLPDPAPQGTPKLTNPGEANPSIAEGGGKIPEFAVEPLIQGDGQQVESTDTVVMQYVAADSDGKTLQSSWEDGAPISANLQDVMEGLKIGLSDQHVGSRLLILVPSAQAQGEGDVVLIVDVLATSTTGD